MWKYKMNDQSSNPKVVCLLIRMLVVGTYVFMNTAEEGNRAFNAFSMAKLSEQGELLITTNFAA